MIGNLADQNEHIGLITELILYFADDGAVLGLQVI